MPTIERSTELPVGVDEAWRFHRDPTNLPAVMPNWLDVTLERVEDPADGSGDGNLLDVGSRVTMTVQPFGRGPRRRLVSHVLECERRQDEAILHDSQIVGPFERWDHVHTFERTSGTDADERCIMTDRVAFALPGGPVGRLGGPLASLALAVSFAIRHRRTRRLLDQSGRPASEDTL